ncbi:MAG: hypothetical protein ACRD4H_06835 [Candidatus Acidiferrales bacterium]
MVGQQLIAMLADHPWFQSTGVVREARSRLERGDAANARADAVGEKRAGETRLRMNR